MKINSRYSAMLQKEIVLFICLLYCYDGEYFEKTGDDIEISQDKMTVTKIMQTNNWNNTSYGYAWIDSWIHLLLNGDLKSLQIVLFIQYSFVWYQVITA